VQHVGFFYFINVCMGLVSLCFCGIQAGRMHRAQNTYAAGVQTMQQAAGIQAIVAYAAEFYIEYGGIGLVVQGIFFQLFVGVADADVGGGQLRLQHLRKADAEHLMVVQHNNFFKGWHRFFF